MRVGSGGAARQNEMQARRKDANERKLVLWGLQGGRYKAIDEWGTI
jgi:hypothetical protein